MDGADGAGGGGGQTGDVRVSTDPAPAPASGIGPAAAAAATLMAAAAVPPPRRPTRFRIGPERNSYNYIETEMTANEHAVYKCERGTGDSPDNVLWLYRSTDGHWLAVENSRNSLDPLDNPKPVFRTSGSDIREIAVACVALRWQYYESGEWHGNMEFATTMLE